MEYLSGLIAEIIGTEPRDPRVLRCVASVQSQVVAYFPNPIAARVGFPFKPTPVQIERAAEHIATFSIAGVRAVGRSLAPERQPRGRRPPR